MGETYVDNRTFHFDIHDVILSNDMDVERLKQRLDDLYKREMGERYKMTIQVEGRERVERGFGVG